MQSMSDTRTRLDSIVNSEINENPGKKINVSAIAKAAGVSHSAIYNRYPEVLASIKTHNSSIGMVCERTKKNQDELIKLKAEKKELKATLVKLASINARYELENAKLKAALIEMEAEKADLLKSIKGVKLMTLTQNVRSDEL